MDNTPIIATITAGEQISNKDLVTINSTGKGFFALPPDQVGAMYRPLNQNGSSTVTNALQQTYIPGVNIVNDLMHLCVDSLVLPNGNFAIAYTASNLVQVAICQPNGQLIADQQVGQSDGVNFTVDMTQLNDGSFAVFFHGGTTAALNVVQFAEDGTLVRPPQVIQQTTGGGAISADAMANGTVVVGFTTDANHSPATVIITPGTNNWTVGTKVQLATLASPIPNNVSIGVAALQNGGYAATYANVSGAVSSSIFNAANTHVKDNPLVGSSFTNCPNGAYVFTTALTGGGYAVAAFGGDNTNSFQLSIFDATGSAQGNTVSLSGYDGNDYPNRLVLAEMVNGNAAVVWCDGIYAYGAVYNGNGVVVSAKANYGQCSGSVDFCPSATGGVVAMQLASNVGTMHVDQNLYGTPFNNPTTTTMTAGTQKAPVIALAVPIEIDSADALPTNLNGMALIAGSTDTVIRVGLFTSYFIDQQVFIGVAQADANENDPLPVQITGTAKLRLPFKQPYLTAAAPGYGTGGWFVGDTAVLKGAL